MTKAERLRARAEDAARRAEEAAKEAAAAERERAAVLGGWLLSRYGSELAKMPAADRAALDAGVTKATDRAVLGLSPRRSARTPPEKQTLDAPAASSIATGARAGAVSADTHG